MNNVNLAHMLQATTIAYFGPSNAVTSQSDQEALQQATINLVNTSLTEEFFLINAAPLNGESGPVYYIKAPTQQNQIVSEGMGYWMKTLTDMTLVNGDSALDYQEKFDGLFRGVERMIEESAGMKANDGLPGWRCKYNLQIGDIEFESNDEAYSATDADLYIAWALICAARLQRMGIWNDTGIDYQAQAEEVLSHIKGKDIIAITDEQGDPHYVITMSDSWGEQDFKGCISFNPSYVVLAALQEFADFDQDGDYWHAVREDQFLLLEAAKRFGDNALAELSLENQNIVGEYSEGLANPVKIIRIERESAEVLRNLLGKIRPDQNELAQFERYGIRLVSPKEYPQSGSPTLDDPLARLDIVRGERGVEINADGSVDICEDTLEFILSKITLHNVSSFFPDVVEVEVTSDSDNPFRARIDVGVRNLAFTENYDGIRVYAELGKDLIYAPASNPLESREQEILAGAINGRYPDRVKAGKYRNIIPISCYFLANVGIGTMDRNAFAREVLNYGASRKTFFDYDTDLRGRVRSRDPEYYNASLTALNLSAYLAAPIWSGIPKMRANCEIEPMDRMPEAEEQLPEPIVEAFGQHLYHMDHLIMITDNALSWKGDSLLDLVPEGLLSDALQAVADENPPAYAISARSRFNQFKAVLENGTNLREVPDPELQYLFAVSLLGIGKYRIASEVFFDIIKTIEDLDSEVGQKVLALSTNYLVNVFSVLNVSEDEIGDIFAWLLEDSMPLTKRMYVRAMFIRQLNKTGRYNLAIEQEMKFFKEYDEYRNDLGSVDLGFLGQYDVGAEAGGYRAEARHLTRRGTNLRLPLPHRQLFGMVVAESIITIGGHYMLTESTVDGVREKRYLYSDAFALANLFLGQRNIGLQMQSMLPVEQQKLLVEDVRRAATIRPRGSNERILALYAQISALAEEMPADFDSRIMFAASKVASNMAWRHRDLVLQRTEGYRPAWIDRYGPSRGVVFDGSGNYVPGDHENEWRRCVAYIDFATGLMDSAMQLELGGIRDAQFINEVYFESTGIAGARADFIRREAKLRQGRLENYYSEADSDDGYMHSDSELAAISASMAQLDEQAAQALEDCRARQRGLIEEYNRPGRAFVSHNFRLPFTAHLGDTQMKAAQTIVCSQPSADPRNAALHTLLGKMQELSVQYGTTLNEPQYFADARMYATLMANVYVSNPNQRALFIFNGLLAYADALFFEAEMYSYSGNINGIAAEGLIDATKLQLLIDYPEYIDYLTPLREGGNIYMLPDDFDAMLATVPAGEIKEGLKELRMQVRYMQIKEARTHIIVIFEVLLGEKRSSQVQDQITFEDARQLLDLLDDNRVEMSKLLAHNPTFKSQAYAKCGNLMWWGTEDKDYHNEALRKYEQALMQDPYNADALIGKAQLFLKKERSLDEALRLTIRALRRLASGENDMYKLAAFKGLFNQFVQLRDALSEKERELIRRVQPIIDKPEELTGEDFRQILEVFKDY
ncbi:MAG: hypothetical protein KKB81_07725 [Candidatus Margulisbacteria bacterium]|nr:hypothetical protein [Candidatus Margulisiibacteriota bacterium]MBU1021237.1 hypothetical protein [Candidatus Margulisiibacteriota bacterium]MBU1729843.1 hypothetical protein [Candidatus Margulisiibacteriota bacterium]MBU1955344.1 hypothetical protein [Candidatus Margulisiibacteriota bacterium]